MNETLSEKLKALNKFEPFKYEVTHKEYEPKENKDFNNEDDCCDPDYGDEEEPWKDIENLYKSIENESKLREEQTKIIDRYKKDIENLYKYTTDETKERKEQFNTLDRKELNIMKKNEEILERLDELDENNKDINDRLNDLYDILEEEIEKDEKEYKIKNFVESTVYIWCIIGVITSGIKLFKFFRMIYMCIKDNKEQ